MNPFVNPKKRDVSLPAGCKDLIDVLRQKSVSPDGKAATEQKSVSPDGKAAVEQKSGSLVCKTAVTDVGLVITAYLPGLRNEDIEITGEGDTIRIIGMSSDSHALFESVVHVPFGYSVSSARAAYLEDELRIIIPKSAALNHALSLGR